jgi:hypothetical protein
MNTHQEMMRILQATNAHYTPPIANGWEPNELLNWVSAKHNATGRNFYFTLNPETKVIKAESFSWLNSGSITAYTGTVALGGRLIAPDMILTLHTLFNFDFASDAIYVVENNRAKLQRSPHKNTKKIVAASADSNAAHSIQSSSFNSRRNARLSKTSRFVRFFVYFESPFRR